MAPGRPPNRVCRAFTADAIACPCRSTGLSTGALCPALSPPCRVRDTCLSLGSTEPPPTYYEFVGVRGCQDVLHLHRLLWASAALNVLGVLLGILTAAVLGAFKDMVSGPGCWGPRPPRWAGWASSSSPTSGETEALEDHQQGVRATASLRRCRRSSSSELRPPPPPPAAAQGPPEPPVSDPGLGSARAHIRGDPDVPTGEREP